jgi:hypothetical protein
MPSEMSMAVIDHLWASSGATVRPPPTSPISSLPAFRKRTAFSSSDRQLLVAYSATLRE